MNRSTHPFPKVGQVWDDHGAVSTVWKVNPDGTAIMKLPTGEKHPVVASFFTRARLIGEALDA